ncbi:MAG: tetratricopeptide repeat protein [Candidatus Competibacteraceae bacterium]|nr:tetratricopeptide repeat protein [Candidatus Competibacteraceae bacterium]
MKKRGGERLPPILWVLFCITLSSSCAQRGPVSGEAEPALAPGTDGARPAALILSSDPGFIEERARQAYQTGRWDVAEGYYLQWMRLKPADDRPWFELGNLYAEQGRLTSAERAYREALRRRDDARTLHNLGLMQVKLGVGALREAQQRLPQDDPARRETHEFLRTLLETVVP